MPFYVAGIDWHTASSDGLLTPSSALTSSIPCSVRGAFVRPRLLHPAPHLALPHASSPSPSSQHTRIHLPVPTYAFPLNPFPLTCDVPTSTDPRFGQPPLRAYHRIAPRRPMHRRTAVLRRDLPARAPAPSFEVPALLGGAHLQPRSQRKKKLAAGPQRQPRRSPWAAKPRFRSACNVGYG